MWHLPHYNNQGNRPAGAIREGRWKLVERYDDGRVELYDLASDPGGDDGPGRLGAVAGGGPAPQVRRLAVTGRRPDPAAEPRF